MLIGCRVFVVCLLTCPISDINLLVHSFALLLCRNWVVSCSLSCVWCQNYCLWRWLHSVAILCWRSFYIVWFVDVFEFCFSWLYSWTTSWLIVIILLRLLTDLHNVLLVSRSAGLPQYGQLGHGTDKEVCLKQIFLLFSEHFINVESS